MSEQIPQKPLHEMWCLQKVKDAPMQPPAKHKSAPPFREWNELDELDGGHELGSSSGGVFNVTCSYLQISQLFYIPPIVDTCWYIYIFFGALKLGIQIKIKRKMHILYISFITKTQHLRHIVKLKGWSNKQFLWCETKNCISPVIVLRFLYISKLHTQTA